MGGSLACLTQLSDPGRQVEGPDAAQRIPAPMRPITRDRPPRGLPHSNGGWLVPRATMRRMVAMYHFAPAGPAAASLNRRDSSLGHRVTGRAKLPTLEHPAGSVLKNSAPQLPTRLGRETVARPVGARYPGRRRQRSEQARVIRQFHSRDMRATTRLLADDTRPGRILRQSAAGPGGEGGRSSNRRPPGPRLRHAPPELRTASPPPLTRSQTL
jgi:hypothetical protein